MIVDGSDPEDAGPVDLVYGTSIKIRALRTPAPKEGPWPEGFPTWHVAVTPPNAARLDILDFQHVNGSPVLEGTPALANDANQAQIVLTATCGSDSESITLNIIRCGSVSVTSASNDFIIGLPFDGIVNVVGVRKPSGTTTISISVDPDTPASRAKISWEGATVVPGSDNLQATVPVNVSERKQVKVLFDGKPCQEIWVWPIWVDLNVKIEGELSPDNKSNLIEAKGAKPFGWPDNVTYQTPDTWPLFIAGGTALGPIDHYGTPNYKHAITGGKVEIEGTISPKLVERIVPTGWSMKRKVVLEKYWDNGGNCSNVQRDPNDEDKLVCAGNWGAGPAVIANTPDDSDAMFQDLAPQGSGKLFDLDVPACPPNFGFSIQHTAEAYMNFDQWVEVDLGFGTTICSDIEPWSYQAQIDGDAQSIVKNILLKSHIPENEMASHYTPR